MLNQKIIAFVVNDLGYFVSHRLPIAVESYRRGFAVCIIYGALGKANPSCRELAAFSLFRVPLERGGVNPLADLRSTILLYRLFRRLRPNLVHLITLKPVVYGGIAARAAAVRSVVSAITGLGYVYVDQKRRKARWLRYVVQSLLRLALQHPRQRLIFQNEVDRQQVLDISRSSFSNTRLIRGSGIDLQSCPLVPEPPGIPVVAMASRLLLDKGVIEFVEAARELRNRGSSALFWLIGASDPANPASLTDAEVTRWRSEGVVEFMGHRSDVLSLYSRAHIIVLPSHREGLPKSLVEAAACGRAVVTTDVPGCRDAIEPGVTGILVHPQDPIALADAIEQLLTDNELRRTMGLAGRQLAEREFGVEQVVEAHMKIYDELLLSCA